MAVRHFPIPAVGEVGTRLPDFSLPESFTTRLVGVGSPDPHPFSQNNNQSRGLGERLCLLIHGLDHECSMFNVHFSHC